MSTRKLVMEEGGVDSQEHIEHLRALVKNSMFLLEGCTYGAVPMDDICIGDVDLLGNLISFPPVMDSASTNRWKYWVQNKNGSEIVQYVNGHTMIVQVYLY